MSAVTVDTVARQLSFAGRNIMCNIGRAGACDADDKNEGDGRTPLGIWQIRGALFRPGHAAPPPGFMLPWRWIGARDGWCDAPDDTAYNRPVYLPHPASTETLIRDDGAYDIILPLGYNDNPPVSGKGSAIFLHLLSPRAYTQGCVAIDRADMEYLLPRLSADAKVHIV